jgi:hypothetical protein
MMVVGALKPLWVAGMQNAGVAPATAEIVVRDLDIAHTFRDIKEHRLPDLWFRDLPRHLHNPQAVLLDTTHPEGPALLLIFEAPDAAQKLVTRVNYRLKKIGREVNLVETGRTLGEEAMGTIRREIGRAYRLLDGGL